MVLTLLPILTFLAVLLIILLPYYLLVVREEEVARVRLQKRLGRAGSVIRASGAGILRNVERLSSIGPLERALSGSNPLARGLVKTIEQAGARVTAGQVVLGSAALTLLAYVVASGLSGQWVAGVIAGLLFGAVPFSVLRIQRSRRLRKFEEHFPEAVDLISRTLRAGHAFATGLKLAADELPEPVASEFRLLHDQQNYGLSLGDGLKRFAERVPIIDARFFVTAVLTQREAGGNLAEVLDNLSSVIRERFQIKRQLRVITAHGRLTGLVLAAMPPALAIFMFLRIPGHFTVLLEDPLGVRMIIGAVVLQVVGAGLIHRLSNVEY